MGHSKGPGPWFLVLELLLLILEGDPLVLLLVDADIEVLGESGVLLGEWLIIGISIGILELLLQEDPMLDELIVVERIGHLQFLEAVHECRLDEYWVDALLLRQQLTEGLRSLLLVDAGQRLHFGQVLPEDLLLDRGDVADERGGVAGPDLEAGHCHVVQDDCTGGDHSVGFDCSVPDCSAHAYKGLVLQLRALKGGVGAHVYVVADRHALGQVGAILDHAAVAYVMPLVTDADGERPQHRCAVPERAAFAQLHIAHHCSVGGHEVCVVQLWCFRVVGHFPEAWHQSVL